MEKNLGIYLTCSFANEIMIQKGGDVQRFLDALLMEVENKVSLYSQSIDTLNHIYFFKKQIHELFLCFNLMISSLTWCFSGQP